MFHWCLKYEVAKMVLTNFFFGKGVAQCNRGGLPTRCGSIHFLHYSIIPYLACCIQSLEEDEWMMLLYCSFLDGREEKVNVTENACLLLMDPV